MGNKKTVKNNNPAGNTIRQASEAIRKSVENDTSWGVSSSAVGSGLAPTAGTTSKNGSMKASTPTTQGSQKVSGGDTRQGKALDDFAKKHGTNAATMATALSNIAGSFQRAGVMDKRVSQNGENPWNSSPYNEDTKIRMGVYGHPDKEDYSDDDIAKMTVSVLNAQKTGSANRALQEKSLKNALDVYKNKRGALPSGYDGLYDYLSKGGNASGDGSVIRNASAAERKELYRLKNTKLSALGLKLHLDALGAENKKAFYEKFGNKTLDELTNKEVGSMVVNGWIDLEEIKATDLTAYMKLSSKYEAYMRSDDVRLDHQIRLGAENTARSAVQAIEATGRGVVNAGAAAADFLIEDKEKSKKITEFVKNNYVGDIDDKYKYMPSGLKTATDIIGSSAQLVPVIGISFFSPALGMALIGTSAFGNSYSSALRDGASKKEAFAYGVLSAAAEIAVEKLAGGVPGLGGGALTKTTERLVNSFRRPAMQKLVRVALEAGGEGFEEVTTYLLDPVFKKLTYAPDAEIDYSIEEAAYNFLGGFAGSAIFGGGAAILGYDIDPASVEASKANEAVRAFAQSAFHKGINHADTQKLLAKAEKAVKNASWYDNKNNAYMVPENLAEIFNAGKAVKANPTSAQSAEIIKKYPGVTPGKVDYEVDNKKIKISHRQALALENVASYTGLNIGFADDLTDLHGNRLNAKYDAESRSIIININGDDPVITSVVHETVHDMAINEPELYRSISDALKLSFAQNRTVMKKAFGEIADRYADYFADGELTSSGNVKVHKLYGDDAALADEEFTATMLSYVMSNPKSLKVIAEYDRNWAQRIYDAIINAYDFIFGKYQSLQVESENLSAALDVLSEKREAFERLFVEGIGEYGGGLDIDDDSGVEMYSASVPFNKQVDMVLSPDSRYNKYVYVGKTSNLLQKIGFDDLPILMTAGHIRAINTPKEKNKPGESRFHGLEKDQIKHIPHMLKNPVMIYDSISEDYENTVCVVTDEFDGDGNPIIVVFKYVEGIEEKNVPSHCVVEAGNYNMVSSQYGRTNFAEHLKSLIKGDKILYVNKSKFERLLNSKTLNLSTGNKVQFLETLDKLGFDKIIHQSGNFVNDEKIKEDYIPRNRLKGLKMGNASSKNSISQKQNFDNENITENVGNSLGNMHNAENTPSVSGGDIGRNSTAYRVYAQARSRYGLENVEDYSDVSFARADIDARNGREFLFEDNTASSAIKDKYNNSLHLSDNIVFERGEGANVEYGTGRILRFDEGGNVIIAVDSGGGYANTITLPHEKVTFVSHNNESTISQDFRTSHPMYERAKGSFDNFLRTGDLEELERFSYNDVRYYLYSSTEKLQVIRSNLLKHKLRDDGINEGHISNTYSEKDNIDPNTYENMSAHDLQLRFYEAVTNYNLAKDISDIYISSGAEVLDVDRMMHSVVDSDNLIPEKRKRSEKNKKSRYFKRGYASNNGFVNGNYMFNDVYRNFQRTFREHFDVVKPLLDYFDRAKGEYARNLMNNADMLINMCKQYDFKPGDDFDKAIQWYGEKNIHLNLNNSKDMKLFKELGFDKGNYQYRDEIDVPFTYEDLVRRFGDERAADVATCSQKFRELYDDYLKRANDTIATIYPGQTERLIKPRRDYFRHFREISDDLFSLGFALTEDRQIDPLLAGKTDRTKPKQSFESYRQERKTEQTDVSAIKGFVDYMQQAEYTININPFIKEFRGLGQTLAYHKSELGLTDLNSFINYLDKFANHIAKKTTGFDRIFTDMFGKNGRTLLNGLELVNRRVMKNAVIGNAGVAIKQVLNLKNGIFYLQKPSLLVNATLGYGKALTSDSSLLEHYNGLFAQSNYLAERFMNFDFASKKSSARKVVENLTSIGDEFAVRSIWLASYEDACRLNVPDAVRYADDIARRCSAGRGIGEKPLVFTQQTTKLILSFLLENNNNWNVWRDFFQDSVKTDLENGHKFSDKNSYLYYKNQKSGGSKFVSNSFKLAIFLLMTAGIEDLIEELTGYRAEFDPVNDFRKGYRDAIKDSGKFDFSTFFDGMARSGKNIVYDFAEHRNFSSVYSAVLSYVDDDPLRSNNEFFGSVPALTAATNVLDDLFIEKDYVGAGMEFTTGFLMPYGGNQLKKSIKGIADVAQGAHYNEPVTKSLVTGEKGGRAYGVEQSAENYVKGALFGSSALGEAREYWDSKEEKRQASKDAARLKEEDFESYKAQVRKSAKTDKLSAELWRVMNETGSDSALAYNYIDPMQNFADKYGREQSFELSEKERGMYQNEQNRLIKQKYAEVVQSKEYKNADDAGKLGLLQKARKTVVTDYAEKIENDYVMKPVIDKYIAVHGEDDVVKLWKKTGDYDLIPVHDTARQKSYTVNGESFSFSLSDEQIDNYNAQNGEEIGKAYQKLMSSHRWKLLSDEKKSAELKAAKESATAIVSERVKWDHVYADAMAEFDARYGEDNPVRRAYEYSHDATVYPYWVLDDSFDFTYNKVKYSYDMSHDDGSYRGGVEYDALSEAYIKQFADSYENAVVGNSAAAARLAAKSDAEIYELLTKFKSNIKKNANELLKNYIIAKAKAGAADAQLKICG